MHIAQEECMPLDMLEHCVIVAREEWVQLTIRAKIFLLEYAQSSGSKALLIDDGEQEYEICWMYVMQ